MTKVASTIRLDRELREEAEKELNEMGLTLTAYLNLAVKQLVIQKEVPFKIKSADDQEEIMNPTTRRAIIKALAEEEGLIEDEGDRFTNVKDAMDALLNHGE